MRVVILFFLLSFSQLLFAKYDSKIVFPDIGAEIRYDSSKTVITDAKKVGNTHYGFRGVSPAVIEGKLGQVGDFPIEYGKKASRDGVLRGVLDNARKFKKVGGGWFGWACMLACPILADLGYEWIEDQQDFVRNKGAGSLKFCTRRLSDQGIAPCSNGLVLYLDPPYTQGMVLDMKHAVCRLLGERYYSDFKAYAAHSGFCYGTKDGSDPSNHVNRRTLLGYNFQYAISIPEYERISFEKFRDAAIPHADLDPTPWMNAARPGQNLPLPNLESDGVSVLESPTTVQTPPYTNPVTGKPEQVTFTIINKVTNNNDNSQTKTVNVTETVTPRPDLESDSAEAPVPEKRDDSSSGGGGEIPPEQSFDLCKEYPEILACQQLGEPDASVFDDINIPHVIDNVTYTKDFLFPETGVCPAPKTFTVSGRQFSLSYEPICGFLEQIRFAVLGVFIFVSMGIVFGSLKGSS